ncbi:hypothetical protein M407DRAFT_228951 [Tulasnella calospora MUT 4182]|uniref:F-box domain-containing protein n=1 Tax=Tulasnella calospora MUT 4182 TaxID=1051891 RepID=A0A0C3QDE9_9AGAM|nr:hypothetical protein M407DRAFT_228951 [Tulasnella calospora MUT 4182]
MTSRASMPLHSLPLEVLLKIFSYLPIQAIFSIEAASSSLWDLIRTNQNVVYRAAAHLHGFVDDDQSHEDAINKTRSCKYLDQALKRPCVSDWLKGVGDWKEFCKKQFILERAWQGALPGPQPDQVPLKSMPQNMPSAVRHFKVDEVERTVIAVTLWGKLLVASIDTQECLWSLPRGYIPMGKLAKFELSHGFIILGRRHMAVLELWRRLVATEAPDTVADQVNAHPLWKFGILDLHGGKIPSFTCQKPKNSEENSEQCIQVATLRVSAYDPVRNESEKAMAVRQATLLSNDANAYNLSYYEIHSASLKSALEERVSWQSPNKIG